MKRAPRPKRPFTLDFTPLRQRRRFLEISQRKLAESAGVHPITLWRTEQNKTAPSIEQLVSMARSLGVPMHTLFNVRDR
jgi:transcriptional regulator with XRE-family HTH domain